MSADVVRTVSSQSWFGRIGDSIKGIVAGVILFLLSFVLLFWNEGRSVKQYKTLNEGSGLVESVSSETVDPTMDKKLIHTTGRADTSEILDDPTFGVSANALRLRRGVEMFQWDEDSQSETRKKLGGGTETVTTYTYKKKWSDRVIDSSRFQEPEGHGNPSAMPYEPLDLTAESVSVGAFRLTKAQVQRIGGFVSLPADAEAIQILELPGTVREGVYYTGADPANPAVGDARVKFETVTPGEVSLVAAQSGDGFRPYKTKAGGTIEMIQTGLHDAESMFEAAHASNRMLTWILRVVGFAMMWIGLGLILKPMSVLADVIPLLGTIVGTGTSLIAFLISLVGSLVTIAVAWLVYRPLLGIVLLAAAVGVIVLIRKKLKRAPAAAVPPPAPA